jgi:hypothetical protein
VFHITMYLTALNIPSYSRTMQLVFPGLPWVDVDGVLLTTVSRKQGKGSSFY